MKKTDSVFSFIGGLSLAVVFVVVFAQVICRYVIKYSLPWATDVTRIAFVVSIFAGMGVGIFRKCHLNIDVFVHILPRKIQEMAGIFSNLLVITFLGFVAWYSIPFIESNGDQFMPYLDWFPMSWIYAVIPLSAAFMLLSLVIDTAKRLRGSEKR